MSPKLRFTPGQGLNYPGYTFKTLADVCEIRREIVDLSNLSDVQFVEYSMPAFDSGKKPKVIFGSEAKSGRISICGDVLLFNKLNVRKKRIWNVRNSPDNSVCSAEFMPVIATGVLQDYMYYAVSTDGFTKAVEECSSGTSNSQKRITPSIFLEQKIACPCSQEQQKIAAFFTVLDERMDLAEKELVLTEKISSVIFEQIYRGDLRLSRFDGTPFPAWQTRKLDQLLSFQNGINASKEQFGTGIKLVSVKEVLSKAPVTYDGIESYINVDEKLAKRFSVEYGDVIFQRCSETAEEAGSANVYLDSRPAVFGGFVIRGKQKADYHPQFIKMALRSHKVRRQIVRLAQGAQHVNIGQEQLSSVEIKFPCLEEQKKIAELISYFEHKEELLVQKLNALKRLKQAFMQQMFV